MEQCPSSNTYSCAHGQEFPRLLWNSKVHDRIYNHHHWACWSHSAPLKSQLRIIHPSSLDLPSYLLFLSLPIMIMHNQNRGTWKQEKRIHIQSLCMYFSSLHAPSISSSVYFLFLIIRYLAKATNYPPSTPSILSALYTRSSFRVATRALPCPSLYAITSDSI